MTYPSKIILTALAFSFAGCILSGQLAHDLTLKVSDETGHELVGAQATITFVDIRETKGETKGVMLGLP